MIVLTKMPLRPSVLSKVLSSLVPLRAEKERERHFRKIHHWEGRLLMLYPDYVPLSHIQKFVKLSDLYRHFNTAFLNFGD